MAKFKIGMLTDIVDVIKNQYFKLKRFHENFIYLPKEKINRRVFMKMPFLFSNKKIFTMMLFIFTKNII